MSEILMGELDVFIKQTFSVSNEDVFIIAQKFKLTKFKKGDFFTKAGRQCDQVGLIKSGLFRIFASVNDKEVTQWISTPGYFVTDLSGFSFGTSARRTIQALTDAEVYLISKRDYDGLRNEIPAWPEIDKAFITKCFLIMEDRIFNHLHMSAEERFDMLFESNPELFNLVPLQYIASMLGMTPETLSRLRKRHLS